MIRAAIKRKNFFPAFFLATVFWLSLFFLVTKTSPDSFFLFFLFYLLLFLASFLTFSLVFGHSRRGLFTAILITISLLLRQLTIANIINLFLLTASLLSLEIYLAHSK